MDPHEAIQASVDGPAVDEGSTLPSTAAKHAATAAAHPAVAGEAPPAAAATEPPAAAAAATAAAYASSVLPSTDSIKKPQPSCKEVCFRSSSSPEQQQQQQQQQQQAMEQQLVASPPPEAAVAAPEDPPPATTTTITTITTIIITTTAAAAAVAAAAAAVVVVVAGDIVVAAAVIQSRDLYPFLVVNIGSGVSILKAKSASSFVRVTGTCIGGGTVLGLARLLFHAKSFRQVVRLSERGTDALDLKVADLCGDAAGSRCIAPDALASRYS
ncbi:uncharacterized protein EMH_0003380 [Eimeria mitis]|uniref:Pantothenate kinase n=1 Tax=Eimeria mitis TaxID=44415 RepID=U6JWT8_9EIME|nr:uncharacterized protein EMH_0003380 [Eimeria mitis]CDJ29246.1 hypothetical protein EMH_0003380 [Eimeria mitis]